MRYLIEELNMPDPFTLTQELKDYMLTLMRTFTNADVAYKKAKEERGLTRQIVRDAWRETARADHYATLLKTWGVDRTPPRAWVTKTDVKLRDNYLYVFRINFYDREQKQHGSKIVSIYDSKLRPFSDVWSDNEDKLDYLDEVWNYQITSYAPAGILS